MSSVMIRREQHIAIEAADVGREFANAPCDIQAKFIVGVLEGIAAWAKSTPFSQTPMVENQLAAIAEEMDPVGKAKVIGLAKKVIEYFE